VGRPSVVRIRLCVQCVAFPFRPSWGTVWPPFLGLTPGQGRYPSSDLDALIDRRPEEVVIVMEERERALVREQQLRLLKEAVITLSLPFEEQAKRLAPYADWCSDLETDLIDPMDALEAVGYIDVLSMKQWSQLKQIRDRLAKLREASSSQACTRTALQHDARWQEIRDLAARLVTESGWQPLPDRDRWFQWAPDNTP
jgi:hypothetical protein